MGDVLRASYWTDVVFEAGRETADAVRRHRRYASAMLLGLLICAAAVAFAAAGMGGLASLIAVVAWLCAVAALSGALFLWKLISIPPRREAEQAKAIERLSAEMERLRPGRQPAAPEGGSRATLA